MLPYNAVQTYDRIPMWVSWLLMIFVGGYIMRLLLAPGFREWFGLVLPKVKSRSVRWRMQPLQ